ncbi:MAG: hypothetical protein AAF585_17485 [Verrucomicrobiota bacterium]
MKANELDSAIEACLDDQLSEAEAQQLSALLEESAEARERYWELASIHGLLEQTLQSASLKAVTSESTATPANPRRYFRWSSITTAAAGVMLGVFGATMVWAYTGAFPGSQFREQVLFESFEGDGPSELSPRFPGRAGEWFGNLTTAVNPEDGLKPMRGKQVAEFTPISTRNFAYAWHIIDLAERPQLQDDQSHYLEVNTSFYSAKTEEPARYQIRLAAFAQAPDEIRPIWNDESLLFDTVMQHTRRNDLASAEQLGWKKLHSRLDIPPGARSLVISIGVAGQNGPPAGVHYLDAVRARIVSSRTLQD